MGESKSNAEVTRLLAARLGFDDEVFQLDDHQLMELALSDSPAAAAGLTADGLRARGFMRVGTPIGTGGRMLTPCSRSPARRLRAAGLHPVAEYRPPARSPTAVGPYPLRSPDPQAALLDQLVLRRPASDAPRRTAATAEMHPTTPRPGRSSKATRSASTTTSAAFGASRR